MAEEERTVERAHIEEREGRQVLVIRWNTGKTSAGRLFGRYGAGGRPDFFRLLFGALAGSLREKFGPQGEELFNKIRDSDEFRKSSKEMFDAIKEWFFNEQAPKYGLDKGDIFMIITEIELDINTGELRWRKDKTELYYWVRSDRCQQATAPKECKELAEENARLKQEVERLRSELSEIKAKLASLLK
ncbi:transcription factor [Pyrobaculum aerophilum]|uniref:Transcription factor n=1 Tax=Pyrobaculum aerophilum TaxID=13773 RepID=A0A371R6K6_9CREN|nr:transcription factor [Pyrobaculum aerophilum]RFA97273.1 transcription factor [Pyrobaculum aerophilum]RFB00127.1 transcription factor [Pyrobaculum aerophilum]